MEVSTAEPLISIVMPCYNASRYLKEALASITNQDYRHMEIICIDDGSKDDTLKILQEYKEKDARIVIVKNGVNKGLIYSLNKGIEIAKGEYLARMDADDVSHRERIASLYRALRHNSNEGDLVSSANLVLNEQGKPLYKSLPKSHTHLALKFVCFVATPLVHPGMLAKTSLLKANPYSYEYIHCEDFELFSRLFHVGARFMNLESSLYLSRKNAGSVSVTFEEIQVNNHLLISAHNINTYFGITLTTRQLRLVCNRINFAASLPEMLDTFSLLDRMRKEFIRNEKISDRSVLHEIDDFISMQKQDILLQALKNRAWHKPSNLVILARIFFLVVQHKRTMAYMWQKIRYKLNETCAA